MTRDSATRDLLNGLPEFEPGWVWLVGAGPGDPGLLTLHGVNALRQADAIVYDALVDQRILDHAPDTAELIYAGKRGGKPSPTQRSISLRLIELARAGKRVLRLKGGDPFVFGRGGEEALELTGAGIPFRVVPGVTAGIGGLAYAGIPATHRDTNSSVTFITGHSVTGEVPDNLNWNALATGAPVIVLYMAVKHMPRIAQRLIDGGRDPQEAVAFVSNAATEKMTVVECTLAEAGSVAASVEPPAVIAIGPVVKLRSALDWVGRMEGRVLDPNPFGQADRDVAS
ncbi:MAG: uroporphyrinogen-III C-methyltransferase [Alphaproteobacteria bacterium]|uniref:uroporphyrinogen-III C-methyltransferase n=1 Tax=Pacificispira sp. TaxID=2888761 RepID=UPI001B1E5FCE|nr:uroporphyrinogen-III C-methyltransferase [Alphaproteobacteria bacterium]MBO6861369.1 uroporphyrinogen-III C-methyltransferase [Alphaproteobacteria bacterium]MEC9268644.1 uroporphyrinogen-III C-methyltransferase [Pseudomonadota bacterium]